MTQPSNSAPHIALHRAVTNAIAAGAPVFTNQPAPTKQVTQVTALELVPGDVVVTITGERLYAAFDVDHDPGTKRTSIWTALRDQDAGVPNYLTRESASVLFVLR